MRDKLLGLLLGGRIRIVRIGRLRGLGVGSTAFRREARSQRKTKALQIGNALALRNRILVDLRPHLVSNNIRISLISVRIEVHVEVQVQIPPDSRVGIDGDVGQIQ
ncbi:hypothetical protein D3C87_1494210 [compost metagenome]